MIPDRELPQRNPFQAVYTDPEAPYTGPGREGLRVMAFNALDQEQRRRLTGEGEIEEYLDEMADAVESQAEKFQDRSLGYTYDAEDAWKYAIRLIIHGQEPDDQVPRY